MGSSLGFSTSAKDAAALSAAMAGAMAGAMAASLLLHPVAGILLNWGHGVNPKPYDGVLLLIAGHGEITASSSVFGFTEAITAAKFVSLLLVCCDERIGEVVVVVCGRIAISVCVGACWRERCRGKREVEDMGRASADCRPIAVPFSCFRTRGVEAAAHSEVLDGARRKLLVATEQQTCDDGVKDLSNENWVETYPRGLSHGRLCCLLLFQRRSSYTL